MNQNINLGFLYVYDSSIPGGPFPIGGVNYAVLTYPTVVSNIDGRAIYDYFYGRTTQFAGKVEFTRVGGSPDLEYSFDGVHWKAFGKTAKKVLTLLEIQNLIPGSQIFFREPYGCAGNIYAVLGVPEQPELIGGIVQREVYIAKSESTDAVIIPGTGLHYVPSTKNYVFKIIPTGENVGKTPEVITGRILPNEEMRDVSYEFEDGVWTVTVYGVQENLNLDVTFPEVDTQAGGSTGNASVEGSQVWGAAGVAYVTSATAESVSVYSAAGTLVKTVVTPAGTTAIPLPAGFYILSKGGSENYKVIVK
ncbi:MAG: hypothetical protein LBP50_00470 [Tannerella sp.]|nr:hypothetical protein [Tannerella sp.]